MPFDPYFSSKQKEEYPVSEAGRELYKELKSLPVKERKKTLWEWKQKGTMTVEQRDARILMARELNTRYSYRNRRGAEKAEKRRQDAAHHTKTVVHRGYNSHSSMPSSAKNNHGFGAK